MLVSAEFPISSPSRCSQKVSSTRTIQRAPRKRAQLPRPSNRGPRKYSGQTRSHLRSASPRTRSNRHPPGRCNGHQHWKSRGRSFSRMPGPRIIYRLVGTKRFERRAAGLPVANGLAGTFVKHYSHRCNARTLAAQAPIVSGLCADRIVLWTFRVQPSVPTTCAPCARGLCTLDASAHTGRGLENWLSARRTGKRGSLTCVPVGGGDKSSRTPLFPSPG